MITELIVYLIGIPIGYILNKKFMVSSMGYSWTNGDRIIGIIFSLTSWVDVATGLICLGIGRLSEMDKPAKW